MDRIGRYQIVQELGRGAMGAVYKALDPQIDRTVAIKVILTANLSPKDLETYKQRFYREARAAGKMSHGSIVTIYDITEDSTGQPYLVMEFVEGRTLDHVMAEATAGGKPLDLKQALEIGQQVASALDYAHRRGVVHRDVKPANILIAHDGVAKIADFGIAKMDGVQLTQTGHMLGTPAFMSPEQFSGGAVDARADLFSLGSILYWMLSGEKPFHADTLSMVTYKVVFADPPPVSQVNPALPPGADAVLERCIAKKPEARYATCKELADDLDALLAGKPVRATPLSEAEKTVVAPAKVPAAPAGVASEKTVATAPAVEHTVAEPAKEAPVPAGAEAIAALPLLERTVAEPGEVAPAVTAGAVKPPAKASEPAWKAPQFVRTAALLFLLAVTGVGAYLFWPQPAPPEEVAVQPEPLGNLPVTRPPGTEGNLDPAKSNPADPSATPQAPADATPEAEPVAAEPQPVAPEAAPPGRGVGKGLRNRAQPQGVPVPSGPMATLRVECAHNFRDGVLEITSGGRQILRANLRGREQGFGVAKIYSGVYNGSVRIPAGQNVLGVRVHSPRSSYDESDRIGGTFRENSSRTLLIEFGRGSGLRVVSRRLTLAWKQPAAGN